MNLFCFSLEGSMDSLYEVVQDSGGDAPVYTIPSRSARRCASPATPPDPHGLWRESARSISMEIAQMQDITSKKKKRRNVSRSVSDNEVLDNAGCDRPTSLWLPAHVPEDLVYMKNNQNEDVMKTNLRPVVQGKGGRGGSQTSTKKKEKPALPPSQNGSYEGWSSEPDRPNSRQRDLIVLSNGAAAEARGASKRSQKAGGKKASGKNDKDTAKKIHSSTAATPPYLDIAVQAQVRRAVPDPGPAFPGAQQENTTTTTYPPGAPDLSAGAAPGGTRASCSSDPSSSSSTRQRWSNPAAWETSSSSSSYHTCRRPVTEYRASAAAVAADYRGGSQPHDPSPWPAPRRSVTQADLSNPDRSTSLGKFDVLRHQTSPAKTEENAASVRAEEPGCEGSVAPARPAGLGKKKVKPSFSLTMRRKMGGKKHHKSFSEETEDETDRQTEGEAEDVSHAGKRSEKTSNSLESLYSGQSSSSGVASVSDGSSNRGSARLEDGGSYHGQFCGKARVHTDFVPSPYDTDSLKLKVGDLISVISKPPMGIWTGMLNNKVGTFKFIYVDVVMDKEKEEEAPKIRAQKLCRRPRPKTLLELLERLQLEEYASALLLNGYETLEDLRHLQEKHLVELNVTDPEHRQRLLAAAEFRYIESEEAVLESEQSKPLSSSEPEEQNDCARDSGCYIPTECSDGPDSHADAHPHPHPHPGT